MTCNDQEAGYEFQKYLKQRNKGTVNEKINKNTVPKPKTLYSRKSNSWFENVTKLDFSISIGKCPKKSVKNINLPSPRIKCKQRGLGYGFIWCRCTQASVNVEHRQPWYPGDTMDVAVVTEVGSTVCLVGGRGGEIQEK